MRLLHALITFVRIFIAEMIIGFTERIRTVSEGHGGVFDLFQLQINVSSLRTSERWHPIVFLILESSNNATVETLTEISMSLMPDLVAEKTLMTPLRIYGTYSQEKGLSVNC